MNERIWRLVAWVVSRQPVSVWLVKRSFRMPYSHLEGYMERWWLFNAYDRVGYRPWLPSIRIHRILRADNERHQHDHPWHARTIILEGGYVEWRGPEMFSRERGDTATLRPDEFHHISHVTPGGVATLFITWGKSQTWGFNVDGVKVPHREYLKDANP